MNIMYREVIERQKLPVILGLLFFMSFMIAIYTGIQYANIFIHDLENIVESIFIATILFIGIAEMLKCRVKYKYSIISDQIIIHKLKDKHENIVENIKFKDIISIGRKNEIKSKFKIASSKSYVCSIFGQKKYCCIYKDGNIYRKFYFEPSGKFASKLEHIIENNLIRG